MRSAWAPVSDPNARCVVDYALARRAVLHGLATGRLSEAQVCDAQTYLRRAAGYHGERTGQDCPVCERDELWHVTYAYGEGLGPDGSGRARSTVELAELAGTTPDFSVFVVEVCRGCGWNHLLVSYVLGTGPAVARRRPARRRSSGVGGSG